MSFRNFLINMRDKWHEDLTIRDREKNNKILEMNNYLKSVVSFCENETMIRQKKDDQSIVLPEYDYLSAIHRYLEVKAITDDSFRLKRVGKKNDGGYIMVENKNGDYSETKIAYSLGICDDVSWDLIMAEKGYKVFQYDHTIDKLPDEHPNFAWSKIGITGESETPELKRMETLIEKNGHKDTNGMLLKCDIEGSEWMMLSSMEKSMLEKFDQIVIELHKMLDFSDEHKEMVINALKNISSTHQCVHVHANNCSYVNYCENMITPNTIEAAFVLKNRHEFREYVVSYPTELDMVNVVGRKDINLGIWNL